MFEKYLEVTYMADKASGRDFAGELAAFKEFAAGVKNDVEYTKYPDFQILRSSAVFSDETQRFYVDSAEGCAGSRC